MAILLANVRRDILSLREVNRIARRLHDFTARPSRSQTMLPPSTRDRVAPPISGTFHASLSFAWLAVHWQTGDHDGHLLAVQCSTL